MNIEIAFAKNSLPAGQGFSFSRVNEGGVPPGPVETAEITVTSFHASPIGGGVLIGKDGLDALRRAVVSVGIAARDPAVGETWRVTGPVQIHPEHGRQIKADIAMPLLPSGRTIVRFLATNRRFEGIGWKTANRLWDTMGERLYDVILARDLVKVADVIGPERAVLLIDGFGLLAEEVEVFRWLDRYGVTPRTAAAAASLWGRGAITRIEADPYVVALLEPWKLVDARAFRLGLTPDDPRRLMAAIEEAFALRYRAGHTAATAGQIELVAARLLSPAPPVVARNALTLSIMAGRVLERPGGLLQSRACWFMEREVERILSKRMAMNVAAPEPESVRAALAAYETKMAHGLSKRQREAIWMAITSPVSLLLGGAGTGKTTTVKAILLASETRPGFEHPQIALSGRAVKRIIEATERPASTVARFLRRIESGKDIPRRGLLVFDEASMLDLPSIYRILIGLPDEVNILLVGDPGQLPPIGPGLPFHRLARSVSIPKVELDIVHRQASKTGIPTIAQAIRNGRLQDLPVFDPARPNQHGVFIAPALPGRIAGAAVGVFKALAGPPPGPGRMDDLHARDVQILCAVKNGPDGIKEINDAIEREWMVHQTRIHGWGLSVGSKVMWLKNDYAKAPIKAANGEAIIDQATGKPVCAGFTNGALGTIRRATEAGAWLLFDDGSADAVVEYDLEKLTRGWAISIHKAQGSAFRRVIVPLARSRLLDRTLIYTAVTRAVDTCVLVGDFNLMRAAVEAVPRAHSRRECLDFDAAFGGAEA